MANLRARQIVPRHLDWVDDDQYSDDGGVPGSSMLGRKLIRNDRALSAHCLRGWCQAYSRRDAINNVVPRIADPNGVVLGPWPHWGTAGSASGEFYIRAALAAGETALVVPFVDQPSRLQPLLGPIDDAAHTITGAAAGAEANYGPFAVRTALGAYSVGLAIYPTDDGVAAQKGDIDAGMLRNRQTFRTDAAGALLINAWVIAGTEFDHVVRLLDGNDNPLTPWKQIVSINTDVNTSDTVTFWPPVADGVTVDDFSKGDLQWESMVINAVDLYAVMFRERPPIDENYPEALHRG